MMTSEVEKMKRKMAIYRQRYIVKIPQKIDSIVRCWKAYCGSGDLTCIEEMKRLTDSLVSGSQTMNIPDVNRCAKALDVALKPIISHRAKITDTIHQKIESDIDALVHAELENEEDQIETPIQPEKADVPEGVAANESFPSVYLLLEKDQELAADLAKQIEYFGYKASRFDSYENLVKACQKEAPSAVVIDPSLETDRLEVSECISIINESSGNPALPVMVVTEDATVESRLNAARADVISYFVKPFNHHELIDQLDDITNEKPTDPLHVVIVEDSYTQATYYSGILRKAGMEVTVMNDPFNVLDVLSSSSVDLILMDMYMPKCSGKELARVVRQFPAYASVPIVFLSAETEVSRQLDAMSLGGDDFLVKPINPKHLVRSVAIRAQRARTLRMMMVTDTLTGLLNHTRIKERLINEVGRATRNRQKLAFAMLDIDHFKSVNDTYGHPVGDRVIKSLSRVLQQRLRNTDSIGRYGGEEFAVVLPDVSGEEARQIMDEIRKNFQEIQHSSGEEGKYFTSTFSCGICCYPDIKTPSEIGLEADKALYRAKGQGRNCVVLTER